MAVVVASVAAKAAVVACAVVTQETAVAGYE